MTGTSGDADQLASAAEEPADEPAAPSPAGVQQGHVHGRSCYWDLEGCCWRCG